MIFQKVADAAEELLKSNENAVTQIDSSTYSVVSSKQDGTRYDINTEIGACTCISGQQGFFCKHQAAVHLKFRVAFPNCPSLSTEDKMALYFVATGTPAHKPFSFFADMTDRNGTKVTETVVESVAQDYITIAAVVQDEGSVPFHFHGNALHTLRVLDSSTNEYTTFWTLIAVMKA